MTTSHPSDLWKEPTASVFSRDIDFGINSGKDRVGQIGINSNYLEHTPSAHLKNITSNRYDDLTSMLTSVGLEKYIRTYIILWIFGFCLLIVRMHQYLSSCCDNSDITENLQFYLSVLYVFCFFIVIRFYDFPHMSFQCDLTNLIISPFFSPHRLNSRRGR